MIFANKFEKIKKEIKKHKYVYITLFIVFVLGVFLRVYNFGPWLHFELDQARDVFVVQDAVKNGVENLPLLGPQARGKDLNLGPIFYYFSYFSSWIFGTSPESMALPDLLFSIFSIPLFYLFARLFLFGRWTAVSISAILSTSLFLVTYGRFAWNPNGMFFWSMVTFYSLLKAYEDRELNAKWFLLFIFGFGVLTQLHFIAFVSAPLAVLFYLATVRIRIPWRIVLGSFFILLFLYSPVILSEIKTKGRNIDSFLEAVKLSDGIETVDDKEAGVNRGFAEKTLRAFQETSTFYWNIISSDNNGGYNIRIKKDNQKFFRIVCNENCKNNLGHHFLAILIFVFSLGIFLFSFVKIFNKKRSKNDLVAENIFNRYLLLFF
ncbi:MAG: glycosyltransferase family 39 protein [Candidatus Moraniibacteriota bacterium]